MGGGQTNMIFSLLCIQQRKRERFLLFIKGIVAQTNDWGKLWDLLTMVCSSRTCNCKK